MYMSDDKSGFNLGRIRNSINRRAAELAGEDSPDAKSFDPISQGGVYTVENADYDRREPPKDEMRKYWRQFETTPIVRKPVTSFASQVVEPGYYIDGDLSESDEEELTDWLKHSSVIEGEINKDWQLLAKKIVIQREVRGTALIEKVPDRNGEHEFAGFKLVNPETMEVITRPNQTILLAPDDAERYEDAPTTDEGEAAAYLQDISETNQTRWGTPMEDRIDEYKIAFTRDEIIKLTRDADIGEAYGTSRIESASNRIEGLKQKLDDNDEAIASKAYPLWLFLFGTEEQPWDRDRIDKFMQAHEMDKFNPGMKQGVRGDVNVETVSGEVAEIAQYLNFDIDYILSAMPMPKYALGSFESTGGQFGAMAQQQDLNRQIKEARRELESEFTPVIEEKAEEMGIDPDEVELKIGDPDRPDDTTGVTRQIMDYQGAGRGGQEQPGDGQSSGDDQSPTDDEPSIEDEEASSRGAQVWHKDVSIAELQLDENAKGDVSSVVYDTMLYARDNTLQQLEEQFNGSPQQAQVGFERTGNTVARRAMQRASFGEVEDALEEELSAVYEEFGSDASRYRSRQNVSYYQTNIENATRDAIDEMLRLMRIELRRAVNNGHDWSEARERIENKYGVPNLRHRSEVISHMEMWDAVESTKLQVFEEADDIIGVRVANDDASRPVCESLLGSEAYFENGAIGDQLSDQTRNEFLVNGFDPLPETPPYHFNCDTYFEPIYEGEQ